MQDRKQTLLVIALLVIFALSIAGAYLYSSRVSSTDASASSAPVKKFRAKPGTERKNVRALVSSKPSVPEETTRAPIKIWGSLEPSDSEDEIVRLKVVEVGAFEDSEGAIDALLLMLEEGSGSGSAFVHAELAAQYALLDPAEMDLAEGAYEKALELAVGSEAHIFVVHAYAEGLLEAGSFARAAEVTEIVGFEAYPLSGDLLEVGTIRGLSLERLGRVDEAQVAYLLVVDAAIDSRGDMSVEASNVFRQASMRLAGLYRSLGKSGEASAVARRVRALLED